MPFSFTVNRCKDCPFIRQGPDGRAKVGDIIRVVHKCGKKRGARIIRDIEAIPSWCPVDRGDAEIPLKLRYDLHYYNSQVALDNMGMMEEMQHFSVGTKYRTRGGWIAKIIALFEDRNSVIREPALLVLHAIPTRLIIGEDITRVSFTVNGEQEARRIEYALIQHDKQKAEEVLLVDKVLGELKIFDLTKKLEE